jgi:Amt family ammonium transporter
MTPGLAFFYGGMVRSKNVLGMLMQNYVTMGVVSLLWVFVTYSLAFGPDWGGHGIIGTLHFFGLAHINQQVPGFVGVKAQSIPPMVFVIFQMMFAIITPAIITGSTADRLKLSAFVIFLCAWSILVYAPIAHWVFSPNGWLAKLGVEDFAGGSVVEMNCGIAGVAVAMVVGRRRGWPKDSMMPHNVPLALVGAGILWFGWFGFNAGSALGANVLSANAFMNTNVAGAAALLAWIIGEKIRTGKSTTLGAASGAVAGLVAITPACGFVNVWGALFIGIAAGFVCESAVHLKFRFKIDDSLDVGGVHLVGGIVGTLLIGFFGSRAINGVNGLFLGGNFTLLLHQALAVAVTILYGFVVTWLIATVIHKTIGMRMSETDETLGMDLALHAERGYELGTGLGVRVGSIFTPNQE